MVIVGVQVCPALSLLKQLGPCTYGHTLDLLATLPDRLLFNAKDSLHSSKDGGA